MARRKKNQLSPLENKVMQIVWDRGNATAEDVRLALSQSQVIKDSTVRTILSRLEEKGFFKHTVDGRTYVYWPKVESRSVATDAVRGWQDRPPSSDPRISDRDRAAGRDD